eukprot:CAMPEP_0204900060 /NCGR_PEP_ID=MMETSP1397-20131031/2234_1 /ASSEMBLY_ACC=CAM_ASM_000891 /TAXON_ID=49980 /ORGANISM="Climacostomum Climacostomum virens, Strain Stock W-24" /LENGTH=742 /DNA_ID=CAMNT_0052068129 /DNA_START=198 /DNA_END=2426 /DNA_ORIENTATION=-
MSELEKSLVAWINSNGLSRTIRAITELCDASVLYELLSQIDLRYFPPGELVDDCFDNWPAKLGNLHKLQKRLEAYSAEVLNLSSLETLDLQAIAKEEDLTQVLKLLENLMHVIINCPKKELYISRIMSLREVFQAKLMAFIQKILDKNLPPTNLEEETKFQKKELQKLKQDKQLLNRQLEEAHRHAFELSQVTDKLKREVKELKNANADLLTELARKAGPSKGSIIEQTGNSAEFDTQLFQRDQLIAELKTALADQKKIFQAQIQALKDENDVANEKMIHLSKVERDLELYKKRLEDLNSYKKKLKEMQEINDSMKDRLNRMDEDSASVGNLKQMLNYYKEQVNVEKEKAAKLSLELDDLKEAERELQKTIKELDESRSFQDTKIKTLLQEIDRVKDQSEVRDSEDSFSLIQSEFSDQIKRLERHNQAMRNSFDSDHIVRQLNEQLDEAIKLRRGAEDKLKAVTKEANELREKLNKLEKLYENYKLEMSLKLSEVQGDLNDKLTEVLQLKSQLTSSTVTRSETDSLSSEVMKLKSELNAQMQETARLYKEKDEVNSKFMGTNERIHDLQTQLAEKEAYLKAFEREKQGIEAKLATAVECERLAQNELQMMKKSSTSGESSQDRLKSLELERDLMKANGEMHSLRLILREKEDSIASLSADKEKLELNVIQLRCDVQNLKESADSSEVSRMQRELMNKDAEIRYLQLVKDEMVESFNRELKVMSMVVYEVGLDMSRISRQSSA